jgi:hypothetical protein
MLTDIQKKRIEVLKNILAKIYLDDYLQKFLVFKG